MKSKKNLILNLKNGLYFEDIILLNIYQALALILNKSFACYFELSIYILFFLFCLKSYDISDNFYADPISDGGFFDVMLTRNILL